MAENKIDTEGNWWCPECKAYIWYPTYDETCDVCGCENIEWHEVNKDGEQ